MLTRIRQFITTRLDVLAVNRTIQIVAECGDVPAGTLVNGEPFFLTFTDELDNPITITHVED